MKWRWEDLTLGPELMGAELSSADSKTIFLSPSLTKRGPHSSCIGLTCELLTHQSLGSTQTYWFRIFISNEAPPVTHMCSKVWEAPSCGFGSRNGCSMGNESRCFCPWGGLVGFMLFSQITSLWGNRFCLQVLSLLCSDQHLVWMVSWTLLI